MFEVLSNVVSWYTTLIKTNPVMGGVISAWFLGSGSFLLKGVPNRIWRAIVKQTTTTITIFNNHEAFHGLQSWLENKDYLKNVRSLQIRDAHWRNSKQRHQKTIGFGSHFFMYKWRPFKIRLEEVQSDSWQEKIKLNLTSLGRSHKMFDDIFKEIQKSKNENDLTVYIANKDGWSVTPNQYKRPMESVFLEESAKNRVIEHLDNFCNGEDWYMKHGLSYQTGIMLHGEPGTGKTSFVKALASKYNKPLYILPTRSLQYAEQLISKLPKDSILLIEDIDSNEVVHKRGEESEKDKDLFNIFDISSVLNWLDGIVVTHGRVLIATTNHIQKLSSALLRDGRFNLKVHIGYASVETLKRFFKNYYPEFTWPEQIVIKDNLAPATIQKVILENLNNPKKALKELTKKRMQPLTEYILEGNEVVSKMWKTERSDERNNIN